MTEVHVCYVNLNQSISILGLLNEVLSGDFCEY